MARPATFTTELADEICFRIATSTDSLRTICEADDMPTDRSVYRWLSANSDFSHQYARAKEFQCQALADGIRDIAADGRNDWMERLAFNGGNPGWEQNGEAVNRSKLRVDTDKWLLSKLLPKKYGDNQKIDLTATVDTTVKQQAGTLAELLTPEQLAVVQEALEKKPDV